MNSDVLREQLIGQWLEFRPEGERALQVGVAQRVLFHTDKMQARTCYRMLFKQLPGTQEIEPGAKPRFSDDKPPAHGQRGKALLQTVLLEEHVAGFFQPRQVGEIHVVEHPRARASLVVPIKLGIWQYGVHGQLGKDKAAILADTGACD